MSIAMPQQGMGCCPSAAPCVPIEALNHAPPVGTYPAPLDLTVSAAPPATGPFTYQWYTAPDAGGVPGAFAAIPGATGPNYTDNEFSNHWLQVIVKNPCSEFTLGDWHVDSPADN